MARYDDRNPDGEDGDWFVDQRCINCDAARQVAPGLIVSRHGKSVFARQPSSEAEVEMAWRAVEVCPTRSVGNRLAHRPPKPAFPLDHGDGVFQTGHNARASFGANSWFVQRTVGNVLIDSPRWTRQLVTAFEQMGGLSMILLTHRDDVADAERYADHFAARVWIHREDAGAAPFATDLLTGHEPAQVRHDITAIPIPGHTRGSVLWLLDNKHLFTGDSLCWHPRQRRLHAFAQACWYSWPEQINSTRRLAESGYTFSRLFAGHGWSHDADPEVFSQQLWTLLEWMPEQATSSPD